MSGGDGYEYDFSNTPSSHRSFARGDAFQESSAVPSFPRARALSLRRYLQKFKASAASPSVHVPTFVQIGDEKPKPPLASKASQKCSRRRITRLDVSSSATHLPPLASSSASTSSSPSSDGRR